MAGLAKGWTSRHLIGGAHWPTSGLASEEESLKVELIFESVNLTVA